MSQRILITGPESTGKSWLAQQLAAHYQTAWVPEVARRYLETLGREYEEHDLLEIARLQLAEEDRLAKETAGYLFCDTGMLVLKIWSLHKYGRCHPYILEQLRERTYLHIFLTNIDLPWEPDPLREHPEQRRYLFNWYRQELAQQQYTLISGSGNKRLQAAINSLQIR